MFNDNGRKDLGDFSFEEFKAMHIGGKFKAKKNFQIVVGEFKDLKPIGVWKYYNLDNKLIREIDFQQRPIKITTSNLNDNNNRFSQTSSNKHPHQ